MNDNSENGNDPSQCQTSGIPHKHLGRIRVIPQKPDRRSDKGRTEYHQFSGMRNVHDIQIIGIDHIPRHIGQDSQRRPDNRRRSGSQTIQTIGHDKLNQLRHVRFFKDIHGMVLHMRKHADILRPKFETVLSGLKNELGGLEIGSWLEPRGGYFISFDSLPGCAKAIVAKAKEAGVVMTDAGATFPYGKDPQDSNIRIAPSYPTPEELKTATEIFVLSVKLVSIDKILEDK